MSADNGIYILKTRDQYRVIHAQAIDNLWWSYYTNQMESDFVPTRLVKYYGGKRYTRDLEKAMKVANAMARDCYILEYGIQILSVNKTWRQIVAEAKKYAALEIQAIKKRGREWQMSELSVLEKIAALSNSGQQIAL